MVFALPMLISLTNKNMDIAITEVAVVRAQEKQQFVWLRERLLLNFWKS
jgi:hypothetical protein